MRFAVIGNCQAAGFLDCLLAFLPKAEGKAFSLGALGAAPDSVARAEEIAAELDGFTHVFAHRVSGERFGPLDHARLAAERGEQVTFVPALGFTGYHPDCVYLIVEGRMLEGPLGPYHSALAAAAFVLGMPVERTVRLFNPLVIRRLGYIDAYAEAADLVTRQFANLGYDIADRLPVWGRHGAFMHTVNHPRLLPIADICRMVAARAGLGQFSLDTLDIVVDRLAEGPVFPVYPPIARALGIPGHWIFRHSAPGGRPIAPIPLESFVERCFEAYAAEPEAVARAVEADLTARRALRRLPRILDRAA
jgi:hypothetical protein